MVGPPIPSEGGPEQTPKDQTNSNKSVIWGWPRHSKWATASPEASTRTLMGNNTWSDTWVENWLLQTVICRCVTKSHGVPCPQECEQPLSMCWYTLILLYFADSNDGDTLSQLYTTAETLHPPYTRKSPCPPAATPCYCPMPQLLAHATTFHVDTSLPSAP